MMLTVSIVSILFLVTVANKSLTHRENGDMADASSHGAQFRGLASVDSKAPLARGSDWEMAVASDLAKTSGRAIASLGRLPSLEEKLRLETLEGKYRVQLLDGKIQEIRYSPQTRDIADAPKALGEPVQFINTYQALFPSQFATVVAMGNQANASGLLKTYALVDSDHQAVAQVFFTTDVQGRLLTVKVEKSKSR